MKNTPFILILISVLSGCATLQTPGHGGPATDVKSSKQEKTGVGQLLGAQPDKGFDPADAEGLPSIPTGTVFSKTFFEGVVQTSFVQLLIVDEADPTKTYRLYIGDKTRQKSVLWDVQTVQPGYFFIELPAGSYRIQSISIPVGSTMAMEEMNATFNVDADKTVYLGTLRVVGKKEKIKLGGVPLIKPGFEYTAEVVDERTAALKEFRVRYPDLKDNIEVKLMKINPPVGNEIPSENF